MPEAQENEQKVVESFEPRNIPESLIEEVTTHPVTGWAIAGFVLFALTIAAIAKLTGDIDKILGFLKKYLGSSPKEILHRQDYQEQLPHGVALDMVYIPEGIFLMGSQENKDAQESEIPQHRVAVSEFYIGKYPVTQKQWFIVSTFPKIERELKPEPSNFKGDNLPVEDISWYDAVEFCKRLSNATKKEYRLPSESEWEYACRAGTSAAYCFGEVITREEANFQENVGETTPAGNYPANDFGLYDMQGNVWEWCLDYWHENYNGAPINGQAWITNDGYKSRVIRGGSWYNPDSDCRSASRYDESPDICAFFIGFRVVCSVQKLH